MKTVAEVLESKEGEEVELFGWIWNKREHGKLVFVDLRDGTGVIQVAANVCMPSERKRAAETSLVGNRLHAQAFSRGESSVSRESPQGAPSGGLDRRDELDRKLRLGEGCRARVS
jgi:aspartyl/asparaginyl-tRNA synthetase